MNAGTVIKWNKFKDREYGGELKPRWFVCVGHTGLLASHELCYLFTTTTQLEQFEAGGPREHHTFCKFDPNKTPFEYECIMDFDEGLYPYPPAKLENNPDIEIKGILDEQNMRMVYNRAVRSPLLSPTEKLDIYDSFIKAGIDVKKPSKV